MTPSRIVLAALTCAAVLGAAAPAGAVTFPTSQRPHTRVATYSRNGVTVPRLQATVKPTAGGLRVAVDAQVHNDLKIVKSVVLRVGRCTGGNLGHPVCPDTLALDVPAGHGNVVTVRRTVVVPVPPRAVDRVLISLTKHGAGRPRPAGTYGELLLDGRAWRGAGAGRAFGLELRPHAGTSIRRIFVDAAAETSTRFRGGVAWTATSGDAVSLSTGLAGEALHPDTTVPAGGRASFFDRPSINVKRQPNAFTAVVRAAGLTTPLAAVLLPWPVS